ncbi:unnamed protein product [Didymodactylos carnosus]|uniref:Uncharacterized protein n=1 Tax=Didymodactylos carnosus TaxID=1234261 RepID=A0A815S839_9BILA|nr:unnamed protein product [Didymodactylos carnosus]CAF4351177.1 unnamed protein product [Didymodactylos carnosus]
MISCVDVLKGHNYLVPVDPFDDNDYSFSHYSPEYDFICLDDVLKRLNQHRNLVNIVILDACRADGQNGTWKSKDITGSLSSLPIIPVYGTSKGLSANVRTRIEKFQKLVRSKPIADSSSPWLIMCYAITFGLGYFRKLFSHGFAQKFFQILPYGTKGKTMSKIFSKVPRSRSYRVPHNQPWRRRICNRF